MPATSFHPLNHGFRFANKFDNQVVDLGPVNITTHGRCGGMVYAALDYWRLNRRVPTRTDLPPDGDALADFIMQRQMKSMSDMGPMFLTKFAQQGAPHVDIPIFGELGPGLSAEQLFQSGVDYIDGIINSIDQGDPIPVGLIAMTFDPARNHQVLAIGYEPAPDRLRRTVLLYDPNHPRVITRLVPQPENNCFVDQFNKQWRTLFNHAGHEVRTPPSFNTPTASPSFATSQRVDRVDVVWVRPDRGVQTAFWDGEVNDARWNAPTQVAPATEALRPLPVAAVSRMPEQLDAFWIGPDRGVGTSFLSPLYNGGNWNAPFPITRPEAARDDSPLVAIARLTDHLDVFWIGSDGAIASTFWSLNLNNARWNPAFPITPPNASGAGSGLAACSRLDHHIDVFWVGPDGSIATTYFDRDLNEGRWNTPFPITPPRAARPGSPVAAVARTPDLVDVFWIGPDGAIGSASWNGQWTTPFPITRPGATGPGSGLAAVCRLDDHFDVFWVGNDRAIGSTFWKPSINQGQWNPEFAITPPNSARQGSPVAAFARDPNQLDVFWVGGDGAMAGTSWNSGLNEGRWNTGFPISPPGVAG